MSTTRAGLRTAAIAGQRRAFNAQGFASSQMRACLGNLPATPPKGPYQERTIELLENFDISAWTSDPVASVINGKVVAGGVTVATVDAFGAENGAMVHSDRAGLEALKNHLDTVDTSVKDYREQIRRIEDKFVGVEEGSNLIANQAMDFKKQDGFTEIEEWTQACMVERRLNDALLEDEAAGKITVHRHSSFIGCVSNFSNFLDLSKKTLRNLEVGVPVVVLSRNNTTQHMYRWFQRLVQLMEEEGMPSSLVTYASLDVAGQRELLAHKEGTTMHFTGSREVAEKLKEVMPNLMAATAGPNTMVATELNDKTMAAACISSTIENAGQCTHMRHLVAPGATLAHCEQIYDKALINKSPLDAVKAGFRPDGFLEGAPTSAGTDPAYTKHPSKPAAYRVNEAFPEDNIDEKWRQGFVDVTSVESLEKLKSPEYLDGLAEWLVRNGPITLAVNGDDDVAQYLFERTAMTVYTVGSLDEPGLTVSARPQEYEAFGEFPARPTLHRFTKFPVLVPSSAPSYNAEFTAEYLEKLGREAFPAEFAGLNTLREAASPVTRGYLRAIFEFLKDACGPKDNTEHVHARTCVSGWQRPPLSNTASVLRADATTSVDALAAYILPYLATNAKECLHVSVDASNTAAVELLSKLPSVKTVVEDEAAFEATQWEAAPFNVQRPKYDGKPAEGGAPMLGSFLSILMPVGHVKCLQPSNPAFIKRWSASKKWLAVEA